MVFSFMNITIYCGYIYFTTGGLPLARFTVYNKITSPEKLALVNEDNKDLLETLKEALKDQVQDVKVSSRLKTSSGS